MSESNNNKSLSDVAYETIKKNILNLKYPPGSSLTESSLAKELDMSRMPVRIAIQKLEGEGWFDTKFQRKILVKEVSKQDVHEIFQLRRLLEINALKMIFDENKNWEYSHRIEEKFVRMRAAQNDLFDWEKADTEMHMEIISIFENERINRIYRNNQDELIRIGVICQKKYDHIHNIHEGLYKFVEAIKNNDYKIARDILLEEHIEAGKEMILEKIQK
jgi:DNA-binding GntR family transcriptional regulator